MSSDAPIFAATGSTSGSMISIVPCSAQLGGGSALIAVVTQLDPMARLIAIEKPDATSGSNS